MAKQSLKRAMVSGLQATLSLLLLHGTASAQKGTVVDKATGKPIAKAYVMHRPSWAIAMTDAQGAFELPGGLAGIKGGKAFSRNTPSLSLQSDGIFELPPGSGFPRLVNALGVNHPLLHMASNRYRAEALPNGIYTLVLPGTAYRLVSMNGQWQCVGRTNTSQSLPTAALAKSSAVPESLIVSRYGYAPSLVLISSQDVGAIKLTANANASPPGMVPLTGGTFKMGSNRAAVEGPIHEVTVSGFYVDSTEVTQADYQVLTGTQPWYRHQSEYSISFGYRQPALGVSWNESALYCNLRSKRDGLDTVFSYSSITKNQDSLILLNDINVDLTKNGYRMPTEAEWEYACKGGQDSIYFWGTNKDIEDSASTYSWWGGNSLVTDSGRSNSPVAMKKPNPYRLYDMAGNAEESVLDSRIDPFPLTPNVNPFFEDRSKTRMAKGGGFNFPSEGMACSARGSIFDYPYGVNSGFRVVLPIR